MLERGLKGLIRLYQWTLSPWVGRNCRFFPTCSNYGLEAIERHGAFKGCYLIALRLLRCHPWGGQGYDPVPETFSWLPQKTQVSTSPLPHEAEQAKCSCHLFKLKK